MQNNRISVGSGTRLSRLLGLGVLGVIAALALGAVMSLSGPQTASASGGNGLTMGHYDIEAEIECVSGDPVGIELEIHAHSPATYNPGDWFVFGGIVQPQFGFDVDADGCTEDVEVTYNLIEASVPGVLIGTRGATTFEADPLATDGVSNPGNYQTTGHDDFDWDFADDEEGFYELRFEGCITTTSGQECDTIWVTFEYV